MRFLRHTKKQSLLVRKFTSETAGLQMEHQIKKQNVLKIKGSMEGKASCNILKDKFEVLWPNTNHSGMIFQNGIWLEGSFDLVCLLYTRQKLADPGPRREPNTNPVNRPPPCSQGRPRFLTRAMFLCRPGGLLISQKWQTGGRGFS